MRFWPRAAAPAARKRPPSAPELTPTEVVHPPPPQPSAPTFDVRGRKIPEGQDRAPTRDAQPGLSKPIARTLPPREAIIHYPDTGWSAWRGLAADSPVALPPAADVMIVRRVGVELPALPGAGIPPRPYQRANLPGSAEPADSAELPWPGRDWG